MLWRGPPPSRVLHGQAGGQGNPIGIVAGARHATARACDNKSTVVSIPELPTFCSQNGKPQGFTFPLIPPADPRNTQTDRSTANFQRGDFVLCQSKVL